MYCSTRYDYLRSFLAPLAALFWTVGAGLILASGGVAVREAGIQSAQNAPDTLNLLGAVTFLLATLLLFCGAKHKVVIAAMTAWLVSSVLILISPDVDGLSRVHLTRVIGVAFAAAWSIAATQRDYLRQHHGGSDAECGACYPQFLPFMILFASNWPFIQQTFAADDAFYRGASVLTGLGDLAFAFSKQIYRPKIAA